MKFDLAGVGRMGPFGPRGLPVAGSDLAWVGQMGPFGPHGLPAARSDLAWVGRIRLAAHPHLLAEVMEGLPE